MLNEYNVLTRIGILRYHCYRWSQKHSSGPDFQGVWQSVGELCTAVAREPVSAAIGFFQKLPASLLPLPCSSDLAWLYHLFDTAENQITF